LFGVPSRGSVLPVTLENLKQFGALKAMAVTTPAHHWQWCCWQRSSWPDRLRHRHGLASAFFESTKTRRPAASSWPWQLMVIVGGLFLLIGVLSSFVSIRTACSGASNRPS